VFSFSGIRWCRAAKLLGFVSGELLVEINQQEVGAVEPEILIPKILQCAEK